MKFRSNLFVRFGYEQRQVYRDFYVNPIQQPDSTSQLLLLNNGKQSYREFLAMLRWNFNERSTIFASYVHSRAHGELNDYNQFFGNFPYPLIRPNQRGPLSSDAPDRGLFWDIIGLPHKFDFIPILDVHTGFPYSRLDRELELRRRGEQGREVSHLPRPRHQGPVPSRLHLSRSSHPVPRRRHRLQRAESLQSARRSAVLRLSQLRCLLQLHRAPLPHRRRLHLLALTEMTSTITCPMAETA